MIDGNICFYGKCRLCVPASIVCAKDDLMEGAVILWLPKSYKLRKWNNPFRHSTRLVCMVTGMNYHYLLDQSHLVTW